VYYRKLPLIIIPLLGNDSVNTARGNKYTTIEDNRCQAMDVCSAWSDQRLFNEKPKVTESSFGVVN
jgi:hypothetical protein